MTDVSIRSARPSDIEAARSVLGTAYSQYEAMFPAENWGPYLADILDVEGRSAVSELLIAERIGGIVGCVSFYSPGAQMSYPSDTFSEYWPHEWAAIRLQPWIPRRADGGSVEPLPRYALNDRWPQALRRSAFIRRERWRWLSPCTSA
jgi:hypothetical protein